MLARFMHAMSSTRSTITNSNAASANATPRMLGWTRVSFSGTTDAKGPLGLFRAIERDEAPRIDLAVLHALQRHPRDRFEPSPSRVADDRRDLIEARFFA